jgi:hypothetical protein
LLLFSEYARLAVEYGGCEGWWVFGATAGKDGEPVWMSVKLEWNLLERTRAKRAVQEVTYRPDMGPERPHGRVPVHGGSVHEQGCNVHQ